MTTTSANRFDPYLTMIMQQHAMSDLPVDQMPLEQPDVIDQFNRGIIMSRTIPDQPSEWDNGRPDGSLRAKKLNLFENKYYSTYGPELTRVNPGDSCIDKKQHDKFKSMAKNVACGALPCTKESTRDRDAVPTDRSYISEFDLHDRSIIQAELDAYYARLYGLTRDELQFILDPESIKPGYPSETFAVLKRNEEKEFGEYRTQRLVLEAWDKLDAGELY